MSSGDRTRRDPVEKLLERISDQWMFDDPLALMFANEDKAVVVDVRGELRMLSSGLIYAREIDEEDVRKAYDEYGHPAVIQLSSQSHRFDKSSFEDVADLEGGAHV